MVTILQPQEIEVFYIIPALRKYLAIEMKKLGYKQKYTAELLGIESAAISQYSSKKRGSKIQFDDFVVLEIAESAKRIKDTLSYLEEMQRLIRVVKMSGSLCKIHKRISGIPEQCNPELINCFAVK